MNSIIQKYINYQNKLKFNKEITRFIFKDFDVQKYMDMMNKSNCIPDNNMNRMFISYFRENLIAHFLNMKYVGDDKDWETDCIFPKNVKNPKENHIKYEIKIQKNMFLKNGDTSGIILKNGRGTGTKVKNLLKTILKNNFLLINSTYPYNIALVEPTKFIYYFNGKKNAKTYNELINDESFLNEKCAELCAFVKNKDLIYLHEYDNCTEYKYIVNDEIFNPFKDLINNYISNLNQR